MLLTILEGSMRPSASCGHAIALDPLSYGPHLMLSEVHYYAGVTNPSQNRQQHGHRCIRSGRGVVEFDRSLILRRAHSPRHAARRKDCPKAVWASEESARLQSEPQSRFRLRQSHCRIHEAIIRLYKVNTRPRNLGSREIRIQLRRLGELIERLLEIRFRVRIFCSPRM